LLEAWTTLRDVAGAARRAGAAVSVVQASHENAAHEQDGVDYRFVRTRAAPRPWLSPPGPIAQAVKALAPDVIHLNGLDFPLHARALCKLGPPVLAQDHGSRPRPAWRAPRSWGYRDIAAFSFTAAAQARPFVEQGHLRRSTRVFSIPESSANFAAGDQQSARSATGFDGAPALLWVGRLDHNKDPLTILDAVELALPRLPDLMLWCCFGDDTLLAPLRRRLAANPALAARVRMLGAVPHARVELLCRAADFFLLGSREEGSGYALIEAIACGATPIVSDIAPFRALTGGGAVGRLVPRGDAAAFAEALIALSGRPRTQLREASLAHFAEHLSFDAVGMKLHAAYRALLGRGDAA
jgi:glycosyltransferase involved in cell wall biosynthesis